jgi:hypothetical protein
MKLLILIIAPLVTLFFPLFVDLAALLASKVRKTGHSAGKKTAQRPVNAR